MKKNNIMEIIAGLFIMLFLYTALSKLLTYKAFSYDLYGSPLLRPLAPLITISLPLVEIAIAVLLFIPGTRKLGFVSSFILMLLFTGYVGYMLAFVPSKDRLCTCGGIIREMTWNQHLLFNIIFTLLGLIGALCFDNSPSQVTRKDLLT